MNHTSLDNARVVHPRFVYLQSTVLEIVVYLDLAHQVGGMVHLLQGLLKVGTKAQHLLIVCQPGRHSGSRSWWIYGGSPDWRTTYVHRYAARFHGRRLLAITQHAESLEVGQRLRFWIVTFGYLLPRNQGGIRGPDLGGYMEEAPTGGQLMSTVTLPDSTGGGCWRSLSMLSPWKLDSDCGFG